MQLGEWILIQAEERGWSLNELAAKAGTSSGGLSMIVNGLRNPGPDVCRRLARAFGVDPITVFEIASLLPPKPVETVILREIARLASQLPEALQLAKIIELRALVRMVKLGTFRIADRVTAVSVIAESSGEYEAGEEGE